MWRKLVKSNVEGRLLALSAKVETHRTHHAHSGYTPKRHVACIGQGTNL